MKPRINPRRRDRAALVRAIRDPEIPLSRLWRAFRSLPPRDRDCLPWVPKLLALES